MSRTKSPAILLSTSQIPIMTTTSETPALGAPSPHIHVSSDQDDQDFSTNPDPRSRAASVATGSGKDSTQHHPDLNTEVAALSTKLVNAINHQTTLDDTLSTTRHELDTARGRIRELEEQVARQQETLQSEVWVKQSSVEEEKNKLLARIIEEKKLSAKVEQEKKKIEQELGDLSTALFEEANRMVIAAKEEAKKEQDALQHKNDQLKAQLADNEGLLKSQQEQLAELKIVMEHMTADHDDHSGTTPSSPGFSKFDSRDDDAHASENTSQTGITEPLSPTYPTSFTHLIQPVLRTDLSSYDDFLALIQTSKKAPSRVSSGSYSGFNPLLGLASAGSMSSVPSNASTSSLAMTGTQVSNSSPQTPNTPGSIASAASAASSVPLPPLKETKFYKRALAEDIEPTLRLDIAPGLSWLARRSVLSAMTEGTLVVEPVPTNLPFATISKPQFYACSLCGETRKDEPHLRNHRFRTSEADSAQRYPLCHYCLSRVRSTCDFLGFLRMVKDGHWRADDADAERATWEESVRLREQMFWCRIGGGVVPASQFHGHPGSTGEQSPRNSEEVERKSVDVGANAIEKTTVGSGDEGDEVAEKSDVSESTVNVTSEPLPVPEPEGLKNTPDSKDSTHLPGAQSPETDGDETKRLSITIPGAKENE